jgi:hypothetical protein
VTRRGENLTCLLFLTLFVALGYGSYLVGEHNRCTWLRTHDHGSYTAYCTSGSAR